MMPLPSNTSDARLLTFVDQWATLLEAEDYAAAFAHTEHLPERGWTPALLRAVIKDYGQARENQIVTLHGEPTDITQRKQVTRHEPNPEQFIGEVWYDLNLDGYASDLTATFDLQTVPGGILVYLDDIHVM